MTYIHIYRTIQTGIFLKNFLLRQLYTHDQLWKIVAIKDGFPMTRKKASVTLPFKVKELKVRNYILPTDHSEILERVPLQAMSRHLKNRKEMLNIQCGFPKDSLCLTNPIAFYGVLSGFVVEGETLIHLSRICQSFCHVLLKDRSSQLGS